ncbi:homeobox domain-containing protein [Vairimorpha ceranae]|uniref:Homeobox domain-containing protein n=1 Tax=Vairimorpha ceranae TaxID=40302 RepID=A0A0F9WS07_9MICR|nr:homeobox domain-containing protein [Vairimorpha ceranae]KAF5140432.1 hypothetical protein G9O61_00g012370 [Vairimorpha ceranae]KKO75668.1 homeobox domain-containing protein [Vairimorpha ceranae]
MKKLIEKECQIQAALGLCLLKNGYENNNSSRCKKSRIQSLILKEVFKLTMYPSSQTKMDLSIMLNLKVKTINVWFQNERQSEKLSLIDAINFDIRSQKIELNPIILYNMYCKIKNNIM